MKFHIRDDLLLVTCLDEDEAMALACYHRDRADLFQNEYPKEARARRRRADFLQNFFMAEVKDGK